MTAVLLQLFGLFAVLSVIAFGGGAGVIPDMQRAAVDQYHWLTAREFLDLFAISRASPGPGSMIVVLIGQKAAGLAGAAVSFVAMFGPTCVIIHFVAPLKSQPSAFVGLAPYSFVVPPLLPSSAVIL